MKLTDLDLHLHHETDAAALVSLDGDRKKATCLPLEAIEINTRKGRAINVTLPEALALRKGLI